MSVAGDRLKQWSATRHVSPDYIDVLARLPVDEDMGRKTYMRLSQAIEDVRATVPDPTPLDEIKAAVDALNDRLGDVAHVADAGNVEVARLVRELDKTDKKATRMFWLGIALAIPTGVISSVLWWLISGRS